MAEIRGAIYEDKHYDSCGNTTIAVFEHDQISIPLCSNCLIELLASVDTFKSTVFCHKCRHFTLSGSGWHYGGRCAKHDMDKDCMETCDNPEART